MLNLSVQNAIDCISENVNLKNFPGEECARIFQEKCAVRNPNRRYRAHIVTVYYISWPPLSQNPPSAPALSFFFFHLLVYKYDNNRSLNSAVLSNQVRWITGLDEEATGSLKRSGNHWSFTEDTLHSRWQMIGGITFEAKKKVKKLWSKPFRKSVIIWADTLDVGLSIPPFFHYSKIDSKSQVIENSWIILRVGYLNEISVKSELGRGLGNLWKSRSRLPWVFLRGQMLFLATPYAFMKLFTINGVYVKAFGKLEMA